ncbi:C1 domain-containing protein [Sphingomonas sanxanigenens]|uniref:Uncharacterized protein n=1 Tax=Sphingomonas sanxanigenens DSM 19645 = NX02 TaxID=1123269 RepID=W0AA47_9SPHN|nr:C1 domain-containing protein [Sphingomonas sanxanigenens]AHE54814.1 hypothetical protein NX02_15670 [Sphingomonas sanxanigenens DSM 19645 = NX02]
MIDQGIKSRPRYAPLGIDAVARYTLLLSDAEPLPHAAFAEGITASSFDERWTIAGNSQAIPVAGKDARDQRFRAQQHMLTALRHRLGRETMGLRLRAIGREPFLWAVHAVAEEAGMGPEEVRLFAHGSSARRVYCTHCRTIIDGVTTNIVACSGCGARLFVRDHFSRRLNAFAGVQVDAEVPGDIPEIETIYP